MKPWEQQQILMLYGRQAEFRCNHCRQPIYINELHVEDPKKGFYPKANGAPDYLPKKPKWTVHLHPCNDILTGRHPVYADDLGRTVVVIETKTGRHKIKQEGDDEEESLKNSDKRIIRIAERILKAMEKSKLDWNVRRCIRTFKGEYKKPLIRLAVRHLKATNQVIKKGKFFYLPKKHTR